MRESAIEKYLTNQIKKLGGLSYKWVSPGNSGVPDRIIILFRKVYFIEVKTLEGKPSKLQKIVLNTLENAGCNILIIHSKGEVDEFCKNCCSEKY